MRYIRSLIKNIPPETIIFTFYFLGALFIISSIGQLIAIWPVLFSGEEVINIW